MRALGRALGATFTPRKPRDSAADLARARAHRLARKHGVNVDADSQERGCYWVTCAQLSGENDPLDGNHFARGAHELLEAVRSYVAHLDKESNE